MELTNWSLLIKKEASISSPIPIIAPAKRILITR